VNTELGYIQTGTSTSPGTRVQFPVNTSSHLFHWWLFTLTQVLY